MFFCVNIYILEISYPKFTLARVAKASAYKKVFLLTHPPEFETDFKFYEKTQRHGNLKESGVKIAYNPDIHAKVSVFDRSLRIVS